MSAYNFDNHNIKWNKLGDLEHLLYSVLNVDEKNYIVHVLFKFDANEKIVLHRHMIPNNTFVVQGEHGLYEPDGTLKEIRPVGSYRSSPPEGTYTVKEEALIKTSSSSSTCGDMTAFFTKYSTITRMSSAHSVTPTSLDSTKRTKIWCSS
jgi:hypothetical protein